MPMPLHRLRTESTGERVRRPVRRSWRPIGTCPYPHGVREETRDADGGRTQSDDQFAAAIGPEVAAGAGPLTAHAARWRLVAPTGDNDAAFTARGLDERTSKGDWTMYKRILAAIDWTPGTETVLNHTRQLAMMTGATVHVLHV